MTLDGIPGRLDVIAQARDGDQQSAAVVVR